MHECEMSNMVLFLTKSRTYIEVSPTNATEMRNNLFCLQLQAALQRQNSNRSYDFNNKEIEYMQICPCFVIRSYPKVLFVPSIPLALSLFYSPIFSDMFSSFAYKI